MYLLRMLQYAVMYHAMLGHAVVFCVALVEVL